MAVCTSAVLILAFNLHSICVCISKYLRYNLCLKLFCYTTEFAIVPYLRGGDLLPSSPNRLVQGLHAH